VEELVNEFRVGLPIEQTFRLLTDVERIAPCLPGAQLQEIEGDEHRGTVKVKVGPITAIYRGTARFVEREEPTRLVLRAEGREARGQGNANATVTLALAPDGDATVVRVVTNLSVTGKVAQFGRGVLGDVSTTLLGQFVERLEAEVLSDVDDPEQVAGSVRSIHSPEPEPIDLLAAAGRPVARAAGPVAALAFVCLLLLLVRRRR